MHWWKREPTAAERRSRTLKALAANLVEGRRPSIHSELAMTLPLMLEALEDAKQPYVLAGIPGHGYVLKAASTMAGFAEAEVMIRKTVAELLGEEADVDKPDT